MGNCSSRLKRRRKGNPTLQDENRDDKPNEDVTYASIDLSSARASRRTKPTTDDDCDYATIHIPSAIRSEPEPKENCDDDYVLMG